MSDAKLEVKPSRPISDEELAEVSAGYVDPDGVTVKGDKVYVTFFSYCGEYDVASGQLCYCPCPRCGQPMYTQFWNPKWVCDPCNFTKYCPAFVPWEGTAESLVAAAKKSCL